MPTIARFYGIKISIYQMQKEHNQKLVSYGDHTDFLVSSSMSSLILAQLAENPELYGVFKEILSNAGNEIYIKSAGQMRLTGRRTVRRLGGTCSREAMCCWDGWTRAATARR